MSKIRAHPTDAGGTQLPLSIVARYFVIGLLPSLAASSVLPFLSIFFVERLGFSLPEAAALLGLSSTFNAVFSIVSGGVLDRFDRTSLSRFGVGLTCVLPAVLILAPFKPLVFLALVLASFGSTLFVSATINLIYVELDKARAQEVYSYYYAANNCGVFVSPILVYLIGYQNLNALFGVALVIHILVAIWYWRCFRPLASNPPQSRPKLFGFHVGKALLYLFLVSFSYALVFNQYFTNIPLLIKKAEVGGRPLYPILVSLNGILVITLQQLYVFLCRRHRPVVLLRLGACCVLFSFLTLSASPTNNGILLSFAVVFTLGEVLINPSVTSLVFAIAPEGSRASWLGICQSARIAGGLGTTVGGFLLGNLGGGAYLTYIVIAAMPLVGISLLLNSAPETE